MVGRRRQVEDDICYGGVLIVLFRGLQIIHVLDCVKQRKEGYRKNNNVGCHSSKLVAQSKAEPVVVTTTSYQPM